MNTQNSTPLSVSRLKIATVAIAALFSITAHAAMPVKVCAAGNLCGEAQEIDDEQMAGVAGKFTIAGDVVGMNLIMASSWQAPNGQKLDGKASLSIGLPSAGKAGYYTTQVSATGTEAANQSTSSGATGSVSGGGSVQNVNGVAQVIQVAGDGNAALNNTSIKVTTEKLTPIVGNGLSSASYTAANGAQAEVSIQNNSALLQLRMPENTGFSMQSMNANGSGNIYQGIKIAANNQQIFNQLQLQVQIKPLTSSAQIAQGFMQSINMLRGR